MNEMLSCTLQLITRPLAIDTILRRGKFVVEPCLALSHARGIHITSNVTKEYRIGSNKVRSNVDQKHVTLDGEKTVNVTTSTDTSSVYPNVKTLSGFYNGVPYNKLHIINVKSTANNTIMTLTDSDGVPLMIHSAGIEGFKNARKGTNIAAQQAAVTFSKRILPEGFAGFRLRIQGIGPGRMGVMKGFEVSGLNIVSITDDTRVSWNPPRAKKQRRI